MVGSLSFKSSQPNSIVVQGVPCRFSSAQLQFSLAQVWFSLGHAQPHLGQAEPSLSQAEPNLSQTGSVRFSFGPAWLSFHAAQAMFSKCMLDFANSPHHMYSLSLATTCEQGEVKGLQPLYHFLVGDQGNRFHFKRIQAAFP
jgi:hypothetical protein